MFKDNGIKMVMVQKKNGRYECPHNCGRTYKRKSGMSQHFTYECGVEPKFKCLVCNKRFSRKLRMITHMKKLHKLKNYINNSLP